MPPFAHFSGGSQSNDDKIPWTWKQFMPSLPYDSTGLKDNSRTSTLGLIAQEEPCKG
jgi:hypothetical protein